MTIAQHLFLFSSINQSSNGKLENNLRPTRICPLFFDIFFHAISFDMVDHCLQMMKKRHKIERDLSIGEEVGWSKNQQVAKSNPTLAAMNKKFGMIHGLSSLANIMSFGSLAMHSWYLASKLEL